MSQNKPISEVTGDEVNGHGSISRGTAILLFTTASRSSLGPNELLVQWGPANSFSTVNGLYRETDHFHLVSRSTMYGALPPRRYTLSRRGIYT